MNESDFKPIITRAALALKDREKINEFKAIEFQEPKFIKQANENKVKKIAQNEFSDDDELLSADEEDSCKNRKQQQQRGSQKDDLEFDIKRARHEVLNFAMNNQRTLKNKKKMQTFQAIKLGAKPPKKPYKNYKLLVEEKKRLKDIREQRKKFHQLGKNQTGMASVKCRSKTKIEKQNKKRAPVTAIDQHYGVAKPKFKRKK